MGNLLGEPFKDYVSNQINDRQAVHGKVNRTVEELQYLNSRNAWIKLASGTSFEQKRLDLLKKNKGDQEENPLLIGVAPGQDLAIRNVLFNGLSSFGKSQLYSPTQTLSNEDAAKENYETLLEKPSFRQVQRAGISGANRAYGVGGTGQHGYSPMPGIMDADIKDLNRGSIKKATINIKAHNRNQFDVIDALYLRLGYTVMLEWGVDKYLDGLKSGNGDVESMGTTLIDRKFWKYTDSSYNEVLPEIEELRKKYKGNYDGMFGVISNFSWTFEADGTYNIKLEIMSQGDIIESLKANLPPNNGGEKSPDSYAKIRLEQLQTTATQNPDVFYTDLYPGLEKILKAWWGGSNFEFSVFTSNVNNFSIETKINFPTLKLDTYTNPDTKNVENVKNSKLQVKLAIATYLHEKFKKIYSKSEKGDEFKLIGAEGETLDLTFTGTPNLFNLRELFKVYFKDKYKLSSTTTSNQQVANIWRNLIVNNIPFSEFRIAYFNQMAKVNLAGGTDDPQFSSPSEEVDPDQLAIQNAEKKMQDNAGKNKVFSYLYKIRTFPKINENPKDLYSFAFDTSWAPTTKPNYANKITVFESVIGGVINPENSDPTIWNKQVGFPTYTPSNNSADIIKLDITPIENQHFIRFGTFLEYFEKNVIPKIDNKGTKTPPPLLKIDYHPNNNICYVIDNSISLNPNKTLISNTSFYSGTLNQRIYPELNLFSNTTPEGFRYGNIMNIYFSFNRIEEIMDGVDANNQISVYKVLKSLATDINESLGNVNNIEPIIDKESNIVRFIDQTPIPGLKTIAKLIPGYEIFEKPEATLEIFGINPSNNTSNFVRSAGITTEISKEYATIITIGATANGAIPGAESTAFSKWNVGIEDRFKNKLIDGEAERGQNLEDQNVRVLEKYIQFIGQKYEKLGFNQNGSDVAISSNYISANKSQVLDYYIYAQSETSKKDSEYIESSIGFLPFNLKLSMDGLSGVKIYNKINVNTAFLPSNYDETLSFIVTGVNHKLSNNEWVTSLDTIATTKEKHDLDPNAVLDTEELLNDENRPQPSSRTSEGAVAPPLTDELSEEEQLLLQASAEAERIEAERIEAETAAASSFSTRNFSK